MTYSFFTILHKYFHCCMCRCCNETAREYNEKPQSTSTVVVSSTDTDTTYDPSTSFTSFTFDDLSNTSTTPVTLSSSTSSFDSIDYHPYKRKNIHVGIIPSSYYSYHSD
jgi:hypothetical protein